MTDIAAILGSEADDLLSHQCQGISSELLHLPGPDFVDRVVSASDRGPRVMRSLQSLFDHGRLGGSGYLSILPVDQGVEHSAGASFAPNPIYFDPENIIRLAIEGGCNAVASTLGVLGAVASRYAHRIPFICKINHNELLTYPNIHDQTLFASVDQAFEMGAVAVGATVYYGSEQSRRQIQEVSEAFRYAHELGMATVLWAYLRNSAFKHEGTDYHTAADLTGQANHLAATIEADIIKQKQAERNGGYIALNFGKTDRRVYEELTTDHPMQQAVRTAVINKRAGGMGLISGRKSFQKPMSEGVELLHAIQDVYQSGDVTVA
ncbi:MAG: class I fructose-bisphosphate aldolase [Gammaproteobacteria bacterium]